MPRTELSVRVRIGREASGHGRWFERLLGEVKFELWIGDAAEIRTKRTCMSRRHTDKWQRATIPSPPPNTHLYVLSEFRLL